MGTDYRCRDCRWLNLGSKTVTGYSCEHPDRPFRPGASQYAHKRGLSHYACARFEMRETMENKKGAKYDSGKIDLTLVPPDAIEMAAQVRMFGVSKYGDAENWKTLEPERWDKALDRHLKDYHKDPYSVDPESGLFTFKHVLCNAMFIASSRAKNAPVGLEFNPQTAPKGWKVRYVCPYCGTGFDVPHSQCPCCLKEV